MQTTLRLDDDLHRRAKAEAARLGISLTAFLEEAIRLTLERHPSPSEACRLPVFDCGGTRPGVRLDDNSALLDYLDQIDGPSRR